MRRWRRGALYLALLLFWSVLAEPLRVAGAAPPRLKVNPPGTSLPSLSAAREMGQALSDLADALPHVANDWGNGSSLDPKPVVQALPDRLAALLPKVDQELDQIGQTLKAIKAPDAAVVRHRAAVLTIHQGYAQVRTSLGELLHSTTPDSAARKAGPLLRQLAAWDGTLQAPVLPTKLPVRPLESQPVTDADPATPASLPVTAGRPVASDSEPVGRVPASIQAVMQEAGTDPLALTAWVYTHTDTQWYPGAQKGAERTLIERAGNDADQALLLVSLLSSSHVPAHLVSAYADVARDLLKGELDVPRSEYVPQVLASTGLPVQTVGGDAVRIPHVWVEAYIGSRWVVLDPSLKRYELQAPQVDAAGKLAYDLYDYLQQPRPGSPLQQYEGRVGDYFGGIDRALRQRSRDTSDELPAGQAPPVRFTPVGSPQVLTGLPDLSPTVTVRLPGLQGTVALADIGLDPLTLTYGPAGDLGAGIVRAFGSHWGVPPHLFDVRPELRVGGRVIATGDAVANGRAQQLFVTLHWPPADEELPRTVVTGNTYALDISPQGTDQDGLKRIDQRRWQGAVTGVSDLMGRTLQALGDHYFTQVDATAARVARWNGYAAVRSASVVLVGMESRRAVLFGTPVTADAAAATLDVKRLAYTPTDLTGHPERAKTFLMLLGAEASWAEHQVLQQVLQVPSVSTVSHLQAQVEAEQTVNWTCKCPENPSGGPPDLDLGTAATVHITDAWNRGLLVIAPSTPLAQGAWRGEGYVVIDPATGASGWFLTGGLAGGWSDLVQAAKSEVISVLVSNVENELVVQAASVALGLTKAETHALAEGWVHGIIDGFVGGAKGELEGLIALPRLAWSAVKAMGNAAIFAVHYATDETYRDEVTISVAKWVMKVVSLYNDLTAQWPVLALELVARFGELIQQRSGLDQDADGFVEWALSYGAGYIAGFATELALSLVITDGIATLVKAGRLGIVSRLFEWMAEVSRGSFRVAVHLLAAAADETGGVIIERLLKQFPKIADELEAIERLAALVAEDEGKIVALKGKAFERIMEGAADYPHLTGRQTESLVARSRILKIEGEVPAGVPDGLLRADAKITGAIEAKAWSPETWRTLAEGIRDGTIPPFELATKGVKVNGPYKQALQLAKHRRTMELLQSVNPKLLRAYGIAEVVAPEEALFVVKVTKDAPLEDVQTVVEAVRAAVADKMGPIAVRIEQVDISNADLFAILRRR